MDIRNKKIVDERKAYWEELNPSEKIAKLKQWKVNCLLCGGMTSFNKRKVEAFGIEVFSELRGKVKEVLEQWLRSRALEDPLDGAPAGSWPQNHGNFKKEGGA